LVGTGHQGQYPLLGCPAQVLLANAQPDKHGAELTEDMARMHHEEQPVQHQAGLPKATQPIHADGIASDTQAQKVCIVVA